MIPLLSSLSASPAATPQSVRERDGMAVPTASSAGRERSFQTVFDGAGSDKSVMQNDAQAQTSEEGAKESEVGVPTKSAQATSPEDSAPDGRKPPAGTADDVKTEQLKTPVGEAEAEPHLPATHRTVDPDQNTSPPIQRERGAPMDSEHGTQGAPRTETFQTTMEPRQLPAPQPGFKVRPDAIPTTPAVQGGAEAPQRQSPLDAIVLPTNRDRIDFPTGSQDPAILSRLTRTAQTATRDIATQRDLPLAMPLTQAISVSDGRSTAANPVATDTTDAGRNTKVSSPSMTASLAAATLSATTTPALPPKHAFAPRAKTQINTTSGPVAPQNLAPESIAPNTRQDAQTPSSGRGTGDPDLSPRNAVRAASAVPTAPPSVSTGSLAPRSPVANRSGAGTAGSDTARLPGDTAVIAGRAPEPKAATGERAPADAAPLRVEQHTKPADTLALSAPKGKRAAAVGSQVTTAPAPSAGTSASIPGPLPDATVPARNTTTPVSQIPAADPRVAMADDAPRTRRDSWHRGASDTVQFSRTEARTAPLVPAGVSIPFTSPAPAPNPTLAFTAEPDLTDMRGTDTPLATHRSEPGSLHHITTPTAPTRAELPAHIARQLADVVAQAPNRPVELTLSPEELGRVRLSLSMTETGIVVSLAAERPETMDLLRRHIDQLGQDFVNLGFEDIAFSFDGDAQDTAEHTDGSAPASDQMTESTEPVQINLRSDGLSGLDLRL